MSLLYPHPDMRGLHINLLNKPKLFHRSGMSGVPLLVGGIGTSGSIKSLTSRIPIYGISSGSSDSFLMTVLTCLPPSTCRRLFASTAKRVGLVENSRMHIAIGIAARLRQSLVLWQATKVKDGPLETNIAFESVCSS